MDQWAEPEGAGTLAAVRTARRASMPARASAAPEGSWRSERDLQHHLRALQERASAIEADLGDLQRSLPYQLLFDGQRVTGLTRSRLDSAVGTVEGLWLGFNVLMDVLAEAGRVVGNGYRPDLEELRIVEWLLFEDSLELAGRRVTPDELLQDLVQALSTTAQIIEEADDVWRRTVPAMARSEEEIDVLLRRAAELGTPAHAEHLRQMQTQVAWLRSQAADDPLGVVEAFERDVQPRLAHVHNWIADEARQQRILDSELMRAETRLTELKHLHARVVEEAGLVWAKIAHPRGLLTPPDSGYLADPPMGLEPWLARLRALSRSGAPRQVRKGLASWLRAAEAALARELEVLEANQQPLRRRQELRGLLSSFRAKAEALGVAGEPVLADIGGRAKAILYTPQTDLDEAGLLVKEYGDRLRVLNSKEVSYR
jgi:hypothetical protein